MPCGGGPAAESRVGAAVGEADSLDTDAYGGRVDEAEQRLVYSFLTSKQLLQGAGVVLLVCCSTPLYMVYVFWHHDRVAAAMRPTVTGYLDTVARGDHAGATRFLCDDARREAQKAATETADGRPHATVVDYEIVDVEVSDFSRGGSDSVDVEVSLSEGERRMVHLELVEEDGRWKICNPPYWLLTPG